VRVSAIQYRETIWSDVYPGNSHTAHCFQPAVQAAEIALDLAPEQRRRTVWRIDGGGGSDENLRWLLARGYQVVAKGMNNRRAEALAQRVRRWDPLDQPNAWVGEVKPPAEYGRKVRVFVKRRLKEEGFCHSYYVTTLSLPSKGMFISCYDDRGGAEVEQFRNDKQGLSMEARRKRSFYGQKGYILLTDLAHNLLADFHHRALIGSAFEGFGLKRIVRDLLTTPGQVVFDNEHLLRVDLLSQKQFSKYLSVCLLRFYSSP